MEYKNILEEINHLKKGAFGEIQFGRECKTLKTVTDEITKETKMQVRFGVTYDNMGRVQEKRENGELPKENQGLAENEVWEIFPYLIANTVTGQKYLRVYPRIENGYISSKSEYKINGKLVEKKEIENLLYASEKSHNGKPSDCMKIKIQNIKAIK